MSGRNVKLVFEYNTPTQLRSDHQFAELIYKTTEVPITKVTKDNNPRNQVNGIARIVVLISRDFATSLTSQNKLDKLSKVGLRLVPDGNLENLHTVSIYRPSLNIKHAIQENEIPMVCIKNRQVQIKKATAPDNSNRVFISFEHATDAKEASQHGCLISGYPVHQNKVTMATRIFIQQCKRCYAWNDHPTQQCTMPQEVHFCSRCNDIHHFTLCRNNRENAICRNCGGDHEAVSMQCPVAKEALQIIKGRNSRPNQQQPFHLPRGPRGTSQGNRSSRSSSRDPRGPHLQHEQRPAPRGPVQFHPQGQQFPPLYQNHRRSPKQNLQTPQQQNHHQHQQPRQDPRHQHSTPFQARGRTLKPSVNKPLAQNPIQAKLLAQQKQREKFQKLAKETRQPDTPTLSRPAPLINQLPQEELEIYSAQLTQHEHPVRETPQETGAYVDINYQNQTNINQNNNSGIPSVIITELENLKKQIAEIGIQLENARTERQLGDFSSEAYKAALITQLSLIYAEGDPGAFLFNLNQISEANHLPELTIPRDLDLKDDDILIPVPLKPLQTAVKTINKQPPQQITTAAIHHNIHQEQPTNLYNHPMENWKMDENENSNIQHLNISKDRRETTADAIANLEEDIEASFQNTELERSQMEMQLDPALSNSKEMLDSQPHQLASTPINYRVKQLQHQDRNEQKSPKRSLEETFEYGTKQTPESSATKKHKTKRYNNHKLVQLGSKAREPEQVKNLTVLSSKNSRTINTSNHQTHLVSESQAWVPPPSQQTQYPLNLTFDSESQQYKCQWNPTQWNQTQTQHETTTKQNALLYMEAYTVQFANKADKFTCPICNRGLEWKTNSYTRHAHVHSIDGLANRNCCICDKEYPNITTHIHKCRPNNSKKANKTEISNNIQTSLNNSANSSNSSLSSSKSTNQA